MAPVPCNSEVLLTSFADNVFPGTYYGKYIFRRDALFSFLMATLHTFSQLGASYLLISLNTGSHHKSMVTVIKHSLCISGIVLSIYSVLTHFIFITTLLNRDGLYYHFTVKETEE